VHERGSNGASGVVAGVGAPSWLLDEEVLAGGVVVVVVGAALVDGPAAGGGLGAGGGFTVKSDPVVRLTSEPGGVGPWARTTAPDRLWATVCAAAWLAGLAYVTTLSESGPW
jgi:hypothetical protein